MTIQPSPGRQLVEAIAAKDHQALRRLLDPRVDFRAMTPRRFWQGACVDDVGWALSQWFEDGDLIVGVEKVDVEDYLDVEHVGYRLRVVSEGRPHLVDQQAYLTTLNGRITWLRVMCAGYRAIDTARPSTTEGDQT